MMVMPPKISAPTRTRHGIHDANTTIANAIQPRPAVTKASHHAAKSNRKQPHPKHPIAKRVCAVMTVAHGAKHQPCVGAPKEPGKGRHHGNRAIGHDVMAEQQTSQNRNFAKQGDDDRLKSDRGLADERCADQPGETRAPAMALPVRNAAPNPATAPISIMPSTPRLRTPERSAISSPLAA